MNINALPKIHLTLNDQLATAEPAGAGRVRVVNESGESQVFTTSQIITAVKHRSGKMWTRGNHPPTEMDRRVFGDCLIPNNALSRALEL